MLTTHSPIVIDECKYPEAILVRNRRFYTPGERSDDRRIAINTSLLSVPHAECFFANLVFLVEGPGDRAFFDVLLHRLRKLRTGYLLSKVVVQESGGKTAFGPWLNLFRSYGKEGDRPIEWLAVMDADAASTDGGQRAIVRALRDSGSQIPIAVDQAITTFGAMDYRDPVARRNAANALNTDLVNLRAHLLSADLEWAICGGGEASVQAVMDQVFVEIGSVIQGDPIAQARHLGSKIDTGATIDRARKEPYLRAMIAEKIHLNSIPGEIRTVIETGLRRIMSQADINALFTEAATVNPRF